MSKQAFPASQPAALSTHDALRIVRELAANSGNVAVIAHARLRKRERRISHADILRVLRTGVCVEGLYRRQVGALAAQCRRAIGWRPLTCVVEIVWREKLLIVTAF
jgi:Domain of unknown function (DUF4258)